MVALALGSVGCGDDDVRYTDKQIVDQLKLEETDDGYAIEGDPFCEVESKLLNDAEEVRRPPRATTATWCSPAAWATSA